jgi:hypothetical protein
MRIYNFNVWDIVHNNNAYSKCIKGAGTRLLTPGVVGLILLLVREGGIEEALHCHRVEISQAAKKRKS